MLGHPELEDKKSLVLNTVANPDEVYIDATGAFHALKKLVNEVSDYLVVIYLRKDKEEYKERLTTQVIEERRGGISYSKS